MFNVTTAKFTTNVYAGMGKDKAIDKKTDGKPELKGKPGVEKDKLELSGKKDVSKDKALELYKKPGFEKPGMDKPGAKPEANDKPSFVYKPSYGWNPNYK